MQGGLQVVGAAPQQEGPSTSAAPQQEGPSTSAAPQQEGPSTSAAPQQEGPSISAAPQQEGPSTSQQPATAPPLHRFHVALSPDQEARIQELKAQAETLKEEIAAAEAHRREAGITDAEKRKMYNHKVWKSASKSFRKTEKGKKTLKAAYLKALAQEETAAAREMKARLVQAGAALEAGLPLHMKHAQWVSPDGNCMFRALMCSKTWDASLKKGRDDGWMELRTRKLPEAVQQLPWYTTVNDVTKIHWCTWAANARGTNARSAEQFEKAREEVMEHFTRGVTERGETRFGTLEDLHLAAEVEGVRVAVFKTGYCPPGEVRCILLHEGTAYVINGFPDHPLSNTPFFGSADPAAPLCYVMLMNEHCGVGRPACGNDTPSNMTCSMCEQECRVRWNNQG
jgi:hypothetical protein